MISYAQNNEDIILHALLHDVEKGFYVDVGANHPVEDSVTLFFYKRGWTGINIEPIPSIYNLLKKKRPLDKNLNIGIAEKKGQLKLHEVGMKRHGLSSFTPSEKIPAFLPQKEYLVPVLPLTKVLAKVNKINFMKIDVEGMEAAVLKSYDWRVKPEALVIEDNNADEWLPIVINNGYVEVCFDGLNRYFVQKGSGRTMSKYQDILNEGVVPYKEWSLTQKSEELNTKLQNMYELHQDLGMKFHAINDNPENTFTIKELVAALKRKISRKIKRIFQLKSDS